MRTGLARSARWAGSIILFALAACGEHEPTIERRGGPMPDGDVTPTPPDCRADGSGGEGGEAATPIRFCQAEIVLRTSCQRCHSRPTQNSAPFSLVTYEDTQEPFGTSGKRRWQRMQEVVASGFMPLRLRIDPPVEPLTCEQKSTLLGWLDQCALPEGGTDCEGRDEALVACE